MALTSYCALDEVRAALGVNADELSDATLSLPVYEIGLARELAKVSTALPGAFSTIKAKPPEDFTADDQRVLDAVRMFSVFTVAVQAGVALPMLAPRSITDGKASLARFNDAPYRDTLARAEALAEQYRDDLDKVYTEIYGGDVDTSLTVPPIATIAVSRSYDPVTGA